MAKSNKLFSTFGGGAIFGFLASMATSIGTFMFVSGRITEGKGITGKEVSNVAKIGLLVPLGATILGGLFGYKRGADIENENIALEAKNETLEAQLAAAHETTRPVRSQVAALEERRNAAVVNPPELRRLG